MPGSVAQPMEEDVYERIKQGYMELKGSDLKVSVLCDHIGITMSEFYQCYHDLDDLRGQLQRETVREMSEYISSAMPDGFDIDVYIDSGLDYIQSNIELFEFSLFGSNDSAFMELWCKSLVKTLKKSTGCEDKLKLEMTAYMIIRGMAFVLSNNLFNDHGSLNQMASRAVSEL